MQFVLARTLGVEGFGVFSFVFSLIFLLAVPATLGSQMSMLRYVPSYLAEEAWGHLRGVIRFGLASSLLGGCVLAIIGAGVTFAMRDSLAPLLYQALLIGFVVLPFMTLVRTRATPPPPPRTDCETIIRDVFNHSYMTL